MHLHPYWKGLSSTTATTSYLSYWLGHNPTVPLLSLLSACSKLCLHTCTYPEKLLFVL